MTDDKDREVTSASQPTGGEQVATEIVGGTDNPQPDPEVVAAIADDAQAAAEEKPNEPPAAQEAEVTHATEAYNLDEPGAGVVEKTVQDDLEARQALAADAHREVPNDELGSLAIDPENLNTIRPDEKVQVVIGERTPGMASDYGIESAEQEQIVKDLAESGQLFDKGGPLVDWTGDKADLSDGVDGLFLAERSKQTGTKLF